MLIQKQLLLSHLGVHSVHCINWWLLSMVGSWLSQYWMLAAAVSFGSTFCTLHKLVAPIYCWILVTYLRLLVLCLFLAQVLHEYYSITAV